MKNMQKNKIYVCRLIENEKKMLKIFVNHEQDKLTENNSGLHLAPLTSDLTVKEPVFIRIQYTGRLSTLLTDVKFLSFFSILNFKKYSNYKIE